MGDDETRTPNDAGDGVDTDVTVSDAVCVSDSVTDVHTLREEYVVRDLLDEASGSMNEKDSVSYLELIGAILGRAQIVEEVMRMMIVRASDEYEHPRQIPEKWTFGRLAKEFKELYPDEAALNDLLESARAVRNSAAHDDLLVVLFQRELLADIADQDAVAGFTIRGMGKNVKLMDWVLSDMLHFLRAHPVDFEPWNSNDDGTGTGPDTTSHS